MSSDEAFLERLVAAMDSVGLDGVIVGMAAAVLQGAPTMTEDIDVLVRDTKRNREKLAELRRVLGGLEVVQASELAPIETYVGGEAPVDIIFDHIPPRRLFASVKSRAIRIQVGRHWARVACLADVIASKEAANRPKDRAQLEILRETARVRAALSKR
jgi:hypothetical protein